MLDSEKVVSVGSQTLRKFLRVNESFAASILLSVTLIGCHSTPVKPSVSAPSGAATSSAATNSAPNASATFISATSTAAPLPQIQVFHATGKTLDSKSTGSKNETSLPVFAQQVTSQGDSRDAVFSPDGTKILFVSRNRISHKQSQAYELHLATMVEKRITFQDGDVSSANYYPDGNHLIYASTTDEIKEEAIYVQNIFKTYLPEALPKKSRSSSKQDARDMDITNLPSSDIYRESFDGREIERLTTSLGFDGEPSTDSSGKRVLFTSDRFGVPNLFIYNSHGLNRLTDGESPDRYGRFSPDLKSVLWSRFSNGYKTSQVMLAEGSVKKALAITSGKSADLHAAWSPDSKTIVFSSNRAGKDFDLYVVDREGKCLRRLTDISGDELYPSFNTDGSKLLFTGNQTGTNQIYLMDFKPGDACLPAN